VEPHDSRSREEASANWLADVGGAQRLIHSPTNAPTSMSNHLALITKTTSLIAAGDIVGAESALAELATPKATTP
jgi:hypothetical protein